MTAFAPMDRRHFVATLGRAAAGAALLSGLPGPPPGRFRGWAWVHGGAEGSLADWTGRFARLRETDVDEVLVSGGETALLGEAARAAGVEFHRWIWVDADGECIRPRGTPALVRAGRRRPFQGR